MPKHYVLYNIILYICMHIYSQMQIHAAFPLQRLGQLCGVMATACVCACVTQSVCRFSFSTCPLPRPPRTMGCLQGSCRERQAKEDGSCGTAAAGGGAGGACQPCGEGLPLDACSPQAPGCRRWGGDVRSLSAARGGWGEGAWAASLEKTGAADRVRVRRCTSLPRCWGEGGTPSGRPEAGPAQAQTG